MTYESIYIVSKLQTGTYCVQLYNIKPKMLQKKQTDHGSMKQSNTVGGIESLNLILVDEPPSSPPRKIPKVAPQQRVIGNSRHMPSVDKSLQSAFQIFQKSRKQSYDLQHVGVKQVNSASRVFGVTCEQLKQIDDVIIPKLPMTGHGNYHLADDSTWGKRLSREQAIMTEEINGMDELSYEERITFNIPTKQGQVRKSFKDQNVEKGMAMPATIPESYERESPRRLINHKPTKHELRNYETAGSQRWPNKSQTISQLAPISRRQKNLVPLKMPVATLQTDSEHAQTQNIFNVIQILNKHSIDAGLNNTFTSDMGRQCFSSVPLKAIKRPKANRQGAWSQKYKSMAKKNLQRLSITRDRFKPKIHKISISRDASPAANEPTTQERQLTQQDDLAGNALCITELDSPGGASRFKPKTVPRQREQKPTKPTKGSQPSPLLRDRTVTPASKKPDSPEIAITNREQKLDTDENEGTVDRELEPGTKELKSPSIVPEETIWETKESGRVIPLQNLTVMVTKSAQKKQLQSRMQQIISHGEQIVDYSERKNIQRKHCSTCFGDVESCKCQNPQFASQNSQTFTASLIAIESQRKQPAQLSRRLLAQNIQIKQALESQDSIENMHDTLQGRYDQLFFQNPDFWQKTVPVGCSFQNTNRDAFLDYLESEVRMNRPLRTVEGRKRAVTVEGNEIKGHLFQMPLESVSQDSDSHTIPSWPAGIKSKTKDWQRDIREARKTTMGFSHLKPNQKFRQKAVEILKNASRERKSSKELTSIDWNTKQNHLFHVQDYHNSVMSSLSQVDRSHTSSIQPFYSKKVEQIPLKGKAGLMTNSNPPETNFVPLIQKNSTTKSQALSSIKRSYNNSNQESVRSSKYGHMLNQARQDNQLANNAPWTSLDNQNKTTAHSLYQSNDYSRQDKSLVPSRDEARPAYLSQSEMNSLEIQISRKPIYKLSRAEHQNNCNLKEQISRCDAMVGIQELSPTTEQSTKFNIQIYERVPSAGANSPQNRRMQNGTNTGTQDRLHNCSTDMNLLDSSHQNIQTLDTDQTNMFLQLVSKNASSTQI